MSLLRVLAALSLGLVVAVGSVPAPVRSADPKDDPAKSVVVKTVTFKGKNSALSKVLQTVQDQTGIEVRRAMAEDPKIDELNLQKVPFWKALDDIAKAADLRVSLYHRDNKIALVEGPYREVPTSYSGPFRITLKKLITLRDLETGAHGCLAKLEVAWHPPFQPFLVETRPDSFALKDDKGLDQEMPRLDKAMGYVGGDRFATEIDVPIPALRRGVPRIGLFKGSLKMAGSAQMLTFTFDELKQAKAKDQDGVSVAITNFDAKVNEDKESLWTVAVALKYPPATFKSENFQINAWLVRNQALLVSRKPNGPRYSENAGYDSDDVAANQVVIRYRWVDDADKKILLGKPADWKFEYTTPGPVIEVPIDFEFKDVPLP
jgi:hypothetical protein